MRADCPPLVSGGYGFCEAGEAERARLHQPMVLVRPRAAAEQLDQPRETHPFAGQDLRVFARVSARTSRRSQKGWSPAALAGASAISSTHQASAVCIERWDTDLRGDPSFEIENFSSQRS